jgi:type I restriction enzyme S subunit
MAESFYSQFLQTVAGVGGSLLRARPSQVGDIEIAVPAMSEQQRIVVQLEKADHVRRIRRYALHMCDELLPAAFLDIFGDPKTNPHNYDVVLVGDVFDHDRGGAKCGPFGSALKKHEYARSGIPVWTMENVQANEFVETGCAFVSEQKYRELEAYDVRNGDILISRAGTVGRMAVVRTRFDKSIMHSNLIRLSLDRQKIAPAYFVVLMTWFAKGVAKLKTGQEDAYTFMNTGTLEARCRQCKSR